MNNILEQSGIYVIINIVDGNKYVGSSIDLKRRQQRHFSDLKNNKHDNILLQSAFNKYGEKFIKFIVLEYINKENLVEREQFYINFFNSAQKGYNLAQVANNNLNYIFTPEVRKKISDAHKGIPLTEEHKKRIGDSIRGMKHTEETKKKMSHSHKGKIPWNKGRKGIWKHKPESIEKMKKPHIGKQVICIETQKIFTSQSEAAEWLGVSVMAISKCCRGELEMVRGYHWRRID